ncbi:MAG: CHAT domain-containing protein [Alphaproteobacteria bacterium]|nr:CHAT domain-containing protein [Alphaproteobacteria bacterium]
MQPGIVIADLFEELFSNSAELRRWLQRHAPEGDRMVRHLPGGNVGIHTVAFEAGDRLDRWGFIDEALFKALLEDFPGRRDLIEQAWRDAGVEGAPPAGASLDASAAEAPMASPTAVASAAGGAGDDIVVRVRILAESIRAERRDIDQAIEWRIPPDLAERWRGQRRGLTGAHIKMKDLLDFARQLSFGDAGVVVTGALQDAGQIMRQSGRRAHVHIELELHEPWPAYPWESILLPGGMDRPMATEPHVTIIRYLGSGRLGFRPTSPEPGRLLLITARPDEVPATNEGVQISALTRAWEGRVDIVADATLHSLRAHLGEVRWKADAADRHRASSVYSVAHVLCHGRAGQLLMSDGELISGTQLATLLRREVSTACILSACRGAMTGEVKETSVPLRDTGAPSDEPVRRLVPGYGWGSTADAFAKAGIPHVVASSQALDIHEAVEASVTWHRYFCQIAPDPVLATARMRQELEHTPGAAWAFWSHLSAVSRA